MAAEVLAMEGLVEQEEKPRMRFGSECLFQDKDEYCFMRVFGDKDCDNCLDSYIGVRGC